ncbi:hypothetical protein Pelo_10684 [Pelomyxa schiedti]|nr:hypothetical protein Pelo_10684 [Pelomyxa schiedti]
MPDEVPHETPTTSSALDERQRPREQNIPSEVVRRLAGALTDRRRQSGQGRRDAIVGSGSPNSYASSESDDDLIEEELRTLVELVKNRDESLYQAVSTILQEGLLEDTRDGDGSSRQSCHDRSNPISDDESASGTGYEDGCGYRVEIREEDEDEEENDQEEEESGEQYEDGWEDEKDEGDDWYHENSGTSVPSWKEQVCGRLEREGDYLQETEGGIQDENQSGEEAYESDWDDEKINSEEEDGAEAEDQTHAQEILVEDNESKEDGHEDDNNDEEKPVRKYCISEDDDDKIKEQEGEVGEEEADAEEVEVEEREEETGEGVEEEVVEEVVEVVEEEVEEAEEEIEEAEAEAEEEIEEAEAEAEEEIDEEEAEEEKEEEGEEEPVGPVSEEVVHEEQSDTTESSVIVRPTPELPTLFDKTRLGPDLGAPKNTPESHPPHTDYSSFLTTYTIEFDDKRSSSTKPDYCLNH